MSINFNPNLNPNDAPNPAQVRQWARDRNNETQELAKKALEISGVDSDKAEKFSEYTSTTPTGKNADNSFKDARKSWLDKWFGGENNG